MQRGCRAVQPSISVGELGRHLKARPIPAVVLPWLYYCDFPHQRNGLCKSMWTLEQEVTAIERRVYFNCLLTAHGRKTRQCSFLWICILFVQIPSSSYLRALPLLSNTSLFLPFFPFLTSSNFCIILKKSVLSVVHTVLRQSTKGSAGIRCFNLYGSFTWIQVPHRS